MQLELLRGIQSIANPVLDVAAQIITMMGEQTVLVVLLCAIYWCYDKELGRGLFATMCASLCVNGAVKDIVRAERPIGQPGIVSQRVHTATGYSFPSGHTQSATTLCTGVALVAKRRSLRIFMGVLAVLVGLSRLYLGVHYPADVLGGWLLGGVIAAAFHFLARGKGFHWAMALCMLLAIVSILTGHSDDTWKSVALTAGLIPGLQLEKRYAAFTTDVSEGKLALRLLLGLVGTGLLYLLPRALLPALLPVKMLSYFLVALFASGVYPCLFRKLGL
ncbi:phosphatase PAP2 family protein [Ruminococcaceae bacterium OttesenSCG-928-L11]|nr:phosphatase PAP2 family protein [Ruminococcaceae bacterium OttesenSCG-928-L11]